MKKKYKVTEGGRLDKLLKHKAAIGMLTASTVILVGMSAATIAFATDEPAEQANVPKVEKSQPEPKTEPSGGIICEEVNTELVSLGEFTVTHYCPCSTCCGVWAENRPDGIIYTASGAVAESGKTIAVDPDVIPYGTEVVIDGHTYIAQDCGGAIRENRVDIYCDSHEEALQLGRYTTEVFVKGGAEDVQN